MAEITLPQRTVAVHVTPEVRQALKILAAQHNTSMGEVIRLLVDREKEEPA